MTIPTLFPARGNHSVKSVAFVCEFASNLSSSELETLLKRYESTPELKNSFPFKAEQRAALQSVQATATGGDPATAPSAALIGLMFSRWAPDGTQDWVVNIQQNAAVVICNRYERWRPSSELAVPLLIDLLAELPHIGVGVVGLQYLDEWTFLAGKDQPAAPLIFEDGAGILGSRVMRETGSWHNNSGWFEEDPERSRKVLVNVNVAVNFDEPTLRFTTSLGHVQRSICQAPMSLDVASANLASEFQLLHSSNKQLLRVMLRPEVQNQIGLFEK